MTELSESAKHQPGYELATRRAALIVASFTAFTVPFLGSAITIALPAIGKSLRIDAVLLGWIPTSYLLAAAVLMDPGPNVRLRRRRLLGRRGARSERNAHHRLPTALGRSSLEPVQAPLGDERRGETQSPPNEIDRVDLIRRGRILAESYRTGTGFLHHWVLAITANGKAG